MLAGFGHRQNKNKGQLLIESMVAITILIVGLLGIFSLLSQSLGFYRVAYEEHVAVNLAAEGIEVVKSLIDANFVAGGVPWNEGLARDGDFGIQYNSATLDDTFTSKNLRYDEATGIYNYTTGTVTGFKRKVAIKNVSVNEIQVNSTVSWKSRGGVELSINLEDHFYNWR